MKRKLFEWVNGNQFKASTPIILIKEGDDEKPFFGYETEPGTTEVNINTLPITLEDIFSPNTKHLGADSKDPDDQKWVQKIKSTSKILAARKVPGFGANLRRSANPNDFIYEVDVTYLNDEDGRRWHMLFGVSSDGKTIHLFAS